ncbi:MAG: DUF2336 domain-containing protein [Beijerinckiaceae bacterium]
MMIRNYLQWSQSATAADRAEAAGILCNVYLHGELEAQDRREAQAALTMALEDPSVGVRKAIAMALAGSEMAPRHMIATLAQDQSEIALIVLANSPVLSDPELVDAMALGDSRAQGAIAQRPYLSSAVSAALAEIGTSEAIVMMIENDGAEVPEFSLKRMIERHPNCGALREALLKRGDLPLDIRVNLVAQVADQLSAFANQRGWLNGARADRLARETKEIGAITVTADASFDDISDIAIRMRKAGQMTPQLLLRSLLCGETRLLTAALADLAEVSLEKASGFVHARGGIGFRALYRKSGMPMALEPAFEAALAAWHEFGAALTSDNTVLSRRMVERVLTSCSSFDSAENDKLIALLLRYQAEAARDEARIAVADMLKETVAPVVLDRDDLELHLEDALALEFRQAA